MLSCRFFGGGLIQITSNGCVVLNSEHTHAMLGPSGLGSGYLSQAPKENTTCVVFAGLASTLSRSLPV